jgi:glycosyltransferase involved in cell wall biosynthesis
VFAFPPGDDGFEESATECGFNVYRPNVPRVLPPKQIKNNAEFLLTSPLAVSRFQRIISDADINIVHVNMPVNVHAAIAAARSDARLVWHFNDMSVPWPINRVTAIMASKLADKVIVAADCIAEYYFSGLNVEPKTVYAPVDVEQFNPEIIDTNESDRWGDTTVIGAVGNINPAKGYEYLLEAIPNVIDAAGEVSVMIAGARLETQEKYHDQLVNLVERLNIEDSVHFIGYQSDVPKFMSQLDIFVLPSVSEACPMVVLEAMAMEKPVVATAVGGVPEQLTDGVHGWLAESKNARALGAALSDAINSPEERIQRGKQARERVRQTFSLEKCVDRHEQIYRHVFQE